MSALERGERRRPYPHTVRSLADALGISEDERASFLASVPKRGANGPEANYPARETPVPALPNPPTPLVGREREVREVRKLLLGAHGPRRLHIVLVTG